MGSSRDTRPASRAGAFLRAACLLTAIANVGGNIALLLSYRWTLPWLGVPIPADLHAFYAVSGFSLLMGVVAFWVWRDPPRSLRLLATAMLGKAAYAVITFYFYAFGDLSWFWLLFGAWDAVYALLFGLYLIHLTRPELTALNVRGVLHPGERPRHGRALLLYYSLSGNGGRAIGAVARGLGECGYHCTLKPIEPVEKDLFHFPYTGRWQGLRMLVRALFRIGAPIAPLNLPDGDWDLIVCESQTWMLGMSAPMEALFQPAMRGGGGDPAWSGAPGDPTARALFARRDAAVVNVCRGLWRRSQAMMVRHIEDAGGRVIGASAHSNPGREPFRLLSLVFFLISGAEDRPAWLARWLTSQYIGDETERALVAFGAKLARRQAVDSAARDVEEGAS